MAGNHEEITDEIRTLLKEDNLNYEAALRLILANQIIISRRMRETQDSVGELKADVKDIKESLGKYPSVVWMWYHKRKTLILGVIVLMVLYTVLFSPINFSDIRQVLLDWAGLPPDLGLSTTPVP